MKKAIAPMVFGLVLATSIAASTASAQASVGFPPTRSPYVDLEYAQELTFVGGQYHGHRDAANVGPQGGPLFGVRYEWRATGPLHLIGELSRISSDRNIVNPLVSGTARNVGTVSRPLYSADFGLGMALTGGKSWHRIVPEISSGIGLISDFRSQPDTGGFKFGTRFAFNFGGGLRIVPGGRWQIRSDIRDRMNTIAYPETYFVPPTGGGTAVVPTSQPKSFWTHNPTFTLGLSYLF